MELGINVLVDQYVNIIYNYVFHSYLPFNENELVIIDIIYFIIIYLLFIKSRFFLI